MLALFSPQQANKPYAIPVILLASICLVFALFSSSKASACSCLAKEPAQYLEQCQQLFIATLTDVHMENKEGPITTVKGKFSAPTHIIKGDPSVIKGVTNERTGTSCDTYLQIGEEYIVCGNGEPLVKHSMCGYTHSLFGDGKQKLMRELSVEVSKAHNQRRLTAQGIE